VQRLVAAQQHAEVVGGFHGHGVLPVWFMTLNPAMRNNPVASRLE
jgi:hypothetical protein